MYRDRPRWTMHGVSKTSPSARPQRRHRRRTTARGGPWPLLNRQGGQPVIYYLAIRLQPHRLFKAVGPRSLSGSTDHAIRGPCLAATFEVPSLDGRLTLNRETGNGGWQTLRLAGKGLPKRKARFREPIYWACFQIRHPSSLSSGARAHQELDETPHPPRLHHSRTDQTRKTKAMAERDPSDYGRRPTIGLENFSTRSGLVPRRRHRACRDRLCSSPFGNRFHLDLSGRTPAIRARRLPACATISAQRSGHGLGADLSRGAWEVSRVQAARARIAATSPLRTFVH